VDNAININKNELMSEISKFFDDRTLSIQQRAVQDYLYEIGTFAQTAGSIAWS
jgi:hypothetical protein